MKLNNRSKQLTCIQCPLGCSLKVYRRNSGEGGNNSPKKVGRENSKENVQLPFTQKIDLLVEGNHCRLGEEYARKEATNPTRSLTTTVATIFEDIPRLPVRTRGEIPLGELFRAMEQISLLLVKSHQKPGDVVVEDLAGTGVPLIATGNTARE